MTTPAGSHEKGTATPHVGSAAEAGVAQYAGAKSWTNEPAVFVEKVPGSPTTFVLFGCVAQGFAIPPFEFRRMMAEVPVTKVYVRDTAQGWYQHAIRGKAIDTHGLFQGLADPSLLVAGRRVFIGNSMGGFAALMFGALLGADRVIAFSPQSFIDPIHKFRYRDSRWWREMTAMYRRHGLIRWSYDLRNPLAAAARPADSTVFYGTEVSLYCIHAERLSGLPGVRLVLIAGEGHDAVRHLRKTGSLTVILHEAAGLDEGSRMEQIR